MQDYGLGTSKWKAAGSNKAEASFPHLGLKCKGEGCSPG